ncbi:MAG: 1-deoxy-D-xylulose-5-phosphate reductoisomerase [Alphaproteobacteria bacterium]
MSSSIRTINIFGVTGSIGQSTRDVIGAHKEKFDVQVLSAHTNVKALAKAAMEFNASYAVIGYESAYAELKNLLAGTEIQVMAGLQALLDAAAMPADISMMAIVGMAGLEPLMNAIENSKHVAIANKEPLVAAGPFVVAKARECGTVLLPVDSEHNAIFQVFEEANRSEIERIILTASGGPFRTWTIEDMHRATPKDALAHPNWDMGAKISVDSATMMNKALEVIEAHYLFAMPPEKIDVIVHPQSLIHSMVEYADGSVLAQMGASDMRTPIANILTYPNRLKTPGNTLNFKDIKFLEFEEVDTGKFPCMDWVYTALKNDLSYSICLNASNEIAVDAFLNNELYFGDIMKAIDHALQSVNSQNIQDLRDVLEFDQMVRAKTLEFLKAQTNKKAVSIS